MMIKNPHRGTGLMPDHQLTVASAEAVGALLSRCPRHAETPLQDAAGLARHLGIESLHIKDESQRMGLGSFKALGAAYAIARDAAMTGDPGPQALKGRTYIAASAGNHGLSVAAGAALFGARAVIYLAETVPEAFADRLRAKGAEVARAGAVYEDSMTAAMDTAAREGWTLLSDSTWPGYTDPALAVMEGYTQLAAEAARQIPAPPSHILLQAGVGGLAAAVAAHARAIWVDAPQIIVVEPANAPALQGSIDAGTLLTMEGPISEMGRLDCKTPSMVALATLSRDADSFVTITEDQAADAVGILSDAGLPTTPSGGAGLAAVLTGAVPLPAEARVFAILSEGPENG